MIATTPADILRFVLARTGEGVGTILVTLTAIEGSSPRAIGAQMAVAEDGRYVGSFSGGCIEAAVVAEAIGTLADARAKLVRFGAGSPYLDIRLPCGGGIDLLFNPRPDPDAIAQALSQHDRREMGALRLGEDGVHSDTMIGARAISGWKEGSFHLGYAPALRVVAMGQGEELTALARLAAAFGAEVSVLSPDERALADLTAEGFDTIRLTARTSLPPLVTDPWTAIISIFHDRDWEEELLPRALQLPSFYVGAIGSRRTQNVRRSALLEAGVPEAFRRKLRTSVGLIPATRDPATLALSALSQIVQDYHRFGGAAAGEGDAHLAGTDVEGDAPLIHRLTSPV
jgi:xanthine dehydrogenase accessory factor